MNEAVLAAAIGAAGVIVAALVHLLDRTVGRNISDLNGRIASMDGKFDDLSDRLDGKIDILANRVEKRIDDLISTQIGVHERLGRLEATIDGDGSVGAHV